MEICCSFKSFASGTGGFSYREDRSCTPQVVPLHSCKKDISSHLRSCKFSAPENEVDVILSRAGIFETLTDIDDLTMLGGAVVPIVDVGFLKRCPAIVKVGLSRFQTQIGELTSEYHREYTRCLENSYSLPPISRLLTTVRPKYRLGIGQ